MIQSDLASLNKILTQFKRVRNMFRKKDVHDNVKKQAMSDLQKLLDDFNVDQDEEGFIVRLQGNSLSISEKALA